jgi:hypothetical protein
MPNVSRRLGLAAAGIAILAVAIPVLAAQPSAPPGQANKPDKGPEVAVTVRGEVAASTDEKGRPTFTLTAGGTTWELSAGPKWFLGDNNPLAAFVGRTVTVSGTHHEGDTDLSVDAINGEAIRAAAKPPWAGGPKAVGEAHPGWKGEGHPGKGAGLENAPGQAKKASPAP